MPEEAIISEAPLVPRKKSRIPLIIGISLLAVASIIGVFYLWPMIFKKKLYECHYCNASFDTQAEICSHININHPDESLPSYCVGDGNGGDLTPTPYAVAISLNKSTLSMPMKIVGGGIGCGGTYDLATDFTMVVKDLYGNPIPYKTVDIVGSPSSAAGFNVKYTRHCWDWWAGGCWANCYHSVDSYNSGTASLPWAVTSDANGEIKGNIGVISYPASQTIYIVTVYYKGLTLGTTQVIIVPSAV